MQSWLFQERSYITLHFINLTTKMLSVISVSGKHCFTTDWFDGSWLDHGFSSVCCYWYWLHSSWQRRCLNTQTKITHKTCDRVLWVHSYRSLHIWMGCFSWVYNVTSLVNTTHLSLSLTDNFWSWSIYFLPELSSDTLFTDIETGAPKTLQDFHPFVFRRSNPWLK